MKARRILAALGFLWSMAVPLRAEVLGNPSISSTSTSATVSFGASVLDLTLINDTASANESYLRIFWCGETPAAAVAAAAGTIRLEPGDSISLKFGAGDGGFGGYCSFSHITAGGETATLRFIGK